MQIIHGLQMDYGRNLKTFSVRGDWEYDADFTWSTCLGVALSIAGALTAAYNRGFAMRGLADRGY